MSFHELSLKEPTTVWESFLCWVRDDVILGVTNTLAIAQGPGREVAKNIDKHIVYEATTMFLLLGPSFISKSKDTTHWRDKAARPWNFIDKH